MSSHVSDRQVLCQSAATFRLVLEHERCQPRLDGRCAVTCCCGANYTSVDAHVSGFRGNKGDISGEILYDARLADPTSHGLAGVRSWVGGHSIGIASGLLRRNARKSLSSTVITVCSDRHDKAGIVMASSTREAFPRRQIGWPVDLVRETQETSISLFCLGALKLDGE
jgi:hypothetical protein